ncbi:hypothetical protein B0H14DRAFT_3498970 [Mycena olivaceomarginata]|nr:hypothetical protein B0H14DRAFT_3498970 [Mycena olivaceomarginata]
MTNMNAQSFQAAPTPPGSVWRPDDTTPAVPVCPDTVYREDILKTIEHTIKTLDDHPELGYEEYRTHDVLTAFMGSHGFQVKKHYHLETAWLASFTHGSGGRTIGINSEMDALKGVGHACGHNLIAISGIQLLGTPAEEGGWGKSNSSTPDAVHKEMDACLMLVDSLSFATSLMEDLPQVSSSSRTKGIPVLGYNNISALRQQLKPTHRVHGIFEGRDWAPNIIPDYAKYICYVRAPTVAEQKETLKRVLPCFDAAALATGCTVKVHFLGESGDLRQNKALGDEVAHIVRSKYGDIDYEWGIKSASTDFGNVTYALPSLHPGFAIPTIVDGGNHTPGFEQAAATEAAHYACLDVSKALAATGVRVIIDDHFYAQVKKTFEEDKAVRGLVN